MARSATDWISAAVAPFRTFDREEKQKQAKKDQARQRELFERTLAHGSYEPQYATQRAQSPQSRSYLESILAGNNPDMIFSTAPNAAADKRIAGAQRDKMFGTQQQLIDQGAALRNQPMPKVGFSTAEHNFADEAKATTKKANSPELTALYEAYLANPTPEAMAAYQQAWSSSREKQVLEDSKLGPNAYIKQPIKKGSDEEEREALEASGLGPRAKYKRK